MNQLRATGRTHSGSRVIAASPATIYAAFVDPEAMVQWRPPEGMTMRIEAFQPRAGGRIRLVLEHQSPDHAVPGKSAEHADIVEGRFVALEPDRKIVEQVEFESDDPAFAGAMTVTTILDPVPGGTEVTIRCDNVPSGISEADHATAIASSLGKLARFVE